MTNDKANEVAAMFRKIGGFTRVEVEQVGGEFAAPNNPYEVMLWCVNARAGNRNLTVVREPASSTDDAPRPPANMTEAKRIARLAKGRATAADRAAFGRMAAEEME